MKMQVLFAQVQLPCIHGTVHVDASLWVSMYIAKTARVNFFNAYGTVDRYLAVITNNYDP